MWASTNKWGIGALAAVLVTIGSNLEQLLLRMALRHQSPQLGETPLPSPRFLDAPLEPPQLTQAPLLSPSLGIELQQLDITPLPPPTDPPLVLPIDPPVIVLPIDPPPTAVSSPSECDQSQGCGIKPGLRVAAIGARRKRSPLPIPAPEIRPKPVIVGGRLAIVQDWPWMVVLMRRNGTYNFRGGALVTKLHIVTAAHCTDRNKDTRLPYTASDITVRVGEYDFSTTQDSLHKDFKVSRITMHPQYNPSNYHNDIAILTLNEDINISCNVWPICQPDKGDEYEGMIATVAGWGTLSYKGEASSILREVSFGVWKQNQCSQLYPTNSIIGSQMCAGVIEGGKDACQGDSGGPLVMEKEGRFQLIGVVSYGTDCAQAGFPGIYTRVNHYLDWIQKTVQQDEAGGGT